jgi:hypothetical protein
MTSAYELEQELLPALRAGDLDQCEQTVAAKLSSLKKSPYHIALDLSITNSLVEVAGYFDEFFLQLPPGKAKAAYTEMNGFAINPSLWWCSPFAYQNYGGHDDYDWLSNWQSGDFDILTITGLEPLQEVYASDASGSKRFTKARELTDLLVVIKFQELIRRSAPHMKELHFPLLATAHDYDFIYEVRPQ